MVRTEIKNLIDKSVKELQKERALLMFKIPAIKIECPERKIHGDYTANIALQIVNILKKNPNEIAQLLSQRLKEKSGRLFEKIEVVAPGFINFFVSKEYLQQQVDEILKQRDKFGELKIGRGKKIQVEFISANPTGPLTVGNARGGPLGDVLANVLRKAGFKVEKAYYINDYGMQVLTLGHSVLKDSQAQYKGSYIDYLNKRIREKSPARAGEMAAEIIVEEMIKKTVDRMGIRYSEWFSEAVLHKSGEVDKVLQFLENKDLLYKKEKALWFKSSEFGDERDRVLVKADGWKTYLAGDIAYHRYKFEKKRFDKVINVWGADHCGDVPGLQAGVAALGHKGKLDIILLQFVTILEKGEKKKMSKRKGIFVTMDELLNQVGSDVVRFLFLQKSADTHLNFDLSLAKEQSEKNPIYYVQYAHARICSILKKCKMQNAKISLKSGALLSSQLELRQMKKQNAKLLEHPSELKLIKELIRFPEIIEDTAKDYQVQGVPQYATELATSFHQFYRDCKVLTETRSLAEARLGLILATKIVLKNALDLMGISAPERM